jgi:cytochrome c peroxidase
MHRRAAASLLAVMAAGCGRATPPGAATGMGVVAPTPTVALSARAALGRQLFFDTGLSASGRQSCASCHDPAYAYAPANALAVQLGGPRLDQPGTRAVPSLRYKEYTRPYSDRYENPDNASPPAPGGGFTWDGRADTLTAQAAIPLTAANEMANANAAAVAAKIAKAPYAQTFKAVFGAESLETPDAALRQAGEALEAFQREDPSFHPYSSRFDRYRNNKIGGALNAAELRGLAVYLDPQRGNCSACHLLGSGNAGSRDMTTDYSFAAIGVPRNAEIPANADPAWFDLGLCGPLRRDHLPVAGGDKAQHCGMFKTPTLRNVATRHAFMHNGVFHTLRATLEFYATRDTDPARWYPKDAQGRVQKFDDLPPAYHASIDTQMPLDRRAAGSPPPLSAQDIDDLLAFLTTLNDD